VMPDIGASNTRLAISTPPMVRLSAVVGTNSLKRLSLEL